MTTYARASAFIDQREGALTIGAYTLGKEYEVLPPTGTLGEHFNIDDTNHTIPCWWVGDPDVIWERIER